MMNPNLPINITFHDKPYAAISPLRPELSQTGRTVLVVGGSTGIGHAIARNFCVAGAAHVILLGRRPDVLSEAVSKLAQAHPKTKVSSKICDMTKRAESKRVWDELQGDAVAIDVLVLNAVGVPALQPILVQGIDRLWEDYENNLHAQLYHVERFYHQPGHDAQKFLLYLSTQEIHRWDSTPQMPGYQLTKSACTCALQLIARDTPVEKMQILSFHPSIVFTEAAKKAGFTEDTLPWTDENIPGQFAVWAASSQATFLHGRFVWSTWDVDELSSGDIRQKIESDPWYLEVGVKGL